MDVLVDVAVVALFILIGGCFNAAEISMISLRESQVRQLAATRGIRGRRLERLVSDPNRFLAAVQIGVTVATMLSSAFGAATVSERVEVWLVSIGVGPGAAGTVALVGTTLVISFFSLVLGELTPKRIGMQRREAIALFASGPLSLLARLFRPVVWLLGRSTNLMVRVLRGDPDATGEEISSEELQSLVAAHESLTSVERRMIADVFEAEGTHVREVMVPRPEVRFLHAQLSVGRAAREALLHPHSRFPVIGRDADDVLGVVHIRDLIVPPRALGRTATVRDLASPVTVVPGTKGVLDALHEMRGAGQHLAVVVDEYGGTDGIVTLEDLVEEIVGEMVAPGGGTATAAPAKAGEVDGILNLDDFAEITGLELPPGPYTTAAGFVMACLGRIPRTGDTVEFAGRTLTVVELDGRRVSRILVSPPTGPQPADGATEHPGDGDGAPRDDAGTAGDGVARPDGPERAEPADLQEGAGRRDRRTARRDPASERATGPEPAVQAPRPGSAVPAHAGVAAGVRPDAPPPAGPPPVRPGVAPAGAKIGA
ncbi:hemolysin family protein [Nakamurella endophytica]|uniref:Membrane protein n=1 Tax=Nakamurella endophytica TaxID=1748367 RepID=A0A917SX75_9ACTN|nr:hemolysin family protein [Nakamurella endophytica]GGM02471.1 membrane protein [Nakamurella endophytica]